MRDAWLLLAWLLFLLELQPVVAKTSPVAAKHSTYTQEEWSDSDSCSEGGVPPTTVNTCTTGAACCLFRASDGETTSSIISGTCANLTFTMFYKTTDCTGPFSTSTPTTDQMQIPDTFELDSPPEISQRFTPKSLP